MPERMPVVANLPTVIMLRVSILDTISLAAELGSSRMDPFQITTIQ
ncbi:MAG: hypothetical protein ACK526_15815 [Planctomyces sp.]|jgi:hypothetical protein